MVIWRWSTVRVMVRLRYGCFRVVGGDCYCSHVAVRWPSFVEHSRPPGDHKPRRNITPVLLSAGAASVALLMNYYSYSVSPYCDSRCSAVVEPLDLLASVAWQSRE